MRPLSGAGTLDLLDDFAWEQDERLRMPRSNLMACAYNAAVNYGSGRAHKKMADLIYAINLYERVHGMVVLDRLVALGVIDSYTPCPTECEMRPGGLFHAKDCENDSNHLVYRHRQVRAVTMLPGGRDGHAGRRAAYVSLVGSPNQTRGL